MQVGFRQPASVGFARPTRGRFGATVMVGSWRPAGLGDTACQSRLRGITPLRPSGEAACDRLRQSTCDHRYCSTNNLNGLPRIPFPSPIRRKTFL